MKTFVSFSGGMDSTYLLWKLLSETTDEVIALAFDASSDFTEVEDSNSAAFLPIKMILNVPAEVLFSRTLAV